MKIFFSYSLLVFCCIACKNQVPSVSPKGKEKVEDSKEQQMSATQESPNSCVIEATIVKALDPSSPDHNDICHRYSCEAVVHIDKIIRCGSSVTITADELDQIKIHFAYTLNPTAELYPTIKPSYPGLKNGSHFSAIVELHIAPGDQTNYVVYGYELK